jgi:predicted nucleotidyltransferase
MNREIDDRIRRIGERLRKEYGAEEVILFGSHATGDASEDSDVDLLVVAPTTERFLERMATVKRLIRDLRRGLPVAPIVLTTEEMADRKRAQDPFIREILETGITI